LAAKALPVVNLKKRALHPFRVVPVPAMVFSASLGTSVTGGVLRRSVLRNHGALACTTITGVQAATTTIRKPGLVFVALGINLFDLFFSEFVEGCLFPAKRVKIFEIWHNITSVMVGGLYIFARCFSFLRRKGLRESPLKLTSTPLIQKILKLSGFLWKF
jgi:hypothetical protein